MGYRCMVKFPGSFSDYTKLTAISAADAPVLTNVTSLERMFSGCSSLASAPNINNWDVNHITDMSLMFEGGPAFLMSRLIIGTSVM